MASLTELTIETMRKHLPQRLLFLNPLDRIKEVLTIPMLGKAIPLTQRGLNSKKHGRRHEARREHHALDALFRRRDGIAEVMLAEIYSQALYKHIQPKYRPVTFRRSYSYDTWMERHR